MVKIYRPSVPGGEHVVVTDAKDLAGFKREFAEALGLLFLGAIILPTKRSEKDISYTPDSEILEDIISHAFQIGFKLEGYKAPTVQEQRLLISGTSIPKESAMVTVGERTAAPVAGTNGSVE